MRPGLWWYFFAGLGIVQDQEVVGFVDGDPDLGQLFDESAVAIADGGEELVDDVWRQGW